MALAFLRDADILAMFADSPHTITVGEENPQPCLFDEFDNVDMESRPGRGVSNRVPKVTVQTSAFPNVANGDSVSISDGETVQRFSVWSHARIDDGALTEILLRPE